MSAPGAGNSSAPKSSDTKPAVEFCSIVKSFGGVLALQNVSLTVKAGECHALMGENGAGKSTLGRILAGIHKPDGGEIRLAGASASFSSPAAARAAGISMVHQELSFCPDLSVAENLSLGHYPRVGRFFVRRAEMRRRAEAMLGRLNVKLDVRQPMRKLSTAHEQIAQIAAAVGAGARIIVFDEPTSSLSDAESQQLFALIDQLRRNGVTILYVSHRMPEVFRLADRITVLRDGQLVGTLERGEASEAQLVTMMIGRTLSARPATIAMEPGPVRLEIIELSSPGKLNRVSLSIRAGEIVGLAGLVGAGRSELARAIFGLDPAATGAVMIDGRPIKLRSTRAAMRAGIGLVPEDRKREGLVLPMSCCRNFALPNLDWLRRLLFMRRFAERRAARDVFDRLRVKTPSLDAPAATLSGGNQQKIVLAKWLARKLKVLIVDEPTRGVDVGAKAAIHELLEELARQGLAILVISSELPEILRISNRVLVMRHGNLVAEVSRESATQEGLLSLMAGLKVRG